MSRLATRRSRKTDSSVPLSDGAIPGYDPARDAAGYRFDAAIADRACAFFGECLTFTAGARMGQRFALEPWQRAIIRAAFGWVHVTTGLRRYREVFIYIPRKNGKTEMAGGLGLLLGFADDEPGAHVYCAAADRDQARMVFNAAKGMVASEPELSNRLRPYQHAIVHEGSRSSLRVVSAVATTKHGANTHGVIIDELHAQPNRDLVDALCTSVGARRQPLIIYITTADFMRESICNEKYEYACKVRDGVVADATFLPVIYEALPGEDWESPAVWRKANPNLGVSISEEYIARECARAKETPTYLNTFLRLHLNMRTQQDVRWVRLEDWDRGNGEIDEAELIGRPCYAGLDLSTTTDLTALVLVFPRDDGGCDVLPRFWIPEANAERRERRDRVPYLTWARQGFVSMTPGNVVDYEAVREELAQCAQRFDLRQVGYDPWNATQLANQLQEDGLNIVQVGQGYKSLTAPSKEFEKLVMSGGLRHGGNPVLRWMASHVAAETDAAGNIKPSKKKSTERIDGIVALIVAIGVWQADPVESAIEVDFI